MIEVAVRNVDRDLEKTFVKVIPVYCEGGFCTPLRLPYHLPQESWESYAENMRNLMTKCEVADVLRVSTRTVHRYVKMGWLKPIRISEQVVRFPEDDVERFLQEGPGARK